ncbi:hypothetical protein [Hippea alviniae]|uniref:hypothetical protein n=1 Tax=Hippea alviniae TaxID=1279027 RepID=UPI0003B4D2E4|nr:hypothetical protein [Hippea alviniae]
MFIAISDESGDLGVTYKGGTRSFVISIALLKGEDNLQKLNETARYLSRPYLDSPLRKWSELKGKVKHDPQRLYNFYYYLWKNFSTSCDFFLFSFFVLDKKEIEKGIFAIDKENFKSYIWEGYKKCFMRVFAFLKKYHYEEKLYPNPPSIKWFLDRNTEREKEIKNTIIDLAKEKGVQLGGPFFISKRGRDRSGREAATSIKIVDLFAGVVRVSVEHYMNNNSHCSRNKCENCSHPNIKVWQLINTNLCIKDFGFWKWRGMIYYPPKNRKTHERFFGKDPFLT